MKSTKGILEVQVAVHLVIALSKEAAACDSGNKKKLRKECNWAHEGKELREGWEGREDVRW